MCLKVVVAPPHPPNTPPPRFDDDEMDPVTSYQLMVRVEVKYDIFTIQHAPPPPHPPLPLDANNVGLIQNLYVSHAPTLSYRFMG